MCRYSNLRNGVKKKEKEKKKQRNGYEIANDIYRMEMKSNQLPTTRNN